MSGEPRKPEPDAPSPRSGVGREVPLGDLSPEEREAFDRARREFGANPPEWIVEKRLREEQERELREVRRQTEALAEEVRLAETLAAERTEQAALRARLRAHTGEPPTEPEPAPVPPSEPTPTRHAGPEQLPGTSRAELEAIRDRLAADGKPHGYNSIAKAAGVHRSTVIRRLTGN